MGLNDSYKNFWLRIKWFNLIRRRLEKIERCLKSVNCLKVWKNGYIIEKLKLSCLNPKTWPIKSYFLRKMWYVIDKKYLD